MRVSNVQNNFPSREISYKGVLSRIDGKICRDSDIIDIKQKNLPAVRNTSDSFLLSACKKLKRLLFERRETGNLPENIEFQHASTVNDAIRWGKKNLKIKKYEGFEQDNIEQINWVNEGLVNVSNRLKGQVKMPECVKYTELSGCVDDAFSAYNPVSSTLKINKNLMNNVDEYLDKILKNMENCIIVSENGRVKIHFYMDKNSTMPLSKDIYNYKKGNITEFTEKIELCENIHRFGNEIASVFYSPLQKIKSILDYDNGKYIETLKTIGIETNTNKIESLNLEQQFELLDSIFKTINVVQSHKQGDAFHSLYHEMGHIQDKHIANRVFPGERYKNESEYPKELKEWLSDPAKMQTASSVSLYSASGPGEFIAETFAELISGSELSEDVMKLYEELDGPEVPKL